MVFDSDGVVMKYDFEEATIGVQFLLKFIEPDKKQNIIEKWQHKC